MSVYVHLSLLIHQMNQSVPQRVFRFVLCPSPGGANSAAPPPGDRWRVLLFGVGCPMLAPSSNGTGQVYSAIKWDKTKLGRHRWVVERTVCWLAY
jgi:hypothetical protein